MKIDHRLFHVMYNTAATSRDVIPQVADTGLYKAKNSSMQGKNPEAGSSKFRYNDSN
jgi:hypothetical protein